MRYPSVFEFNEEYIMPEYNKFLANFKEKSDLEYHNIEFFVFDYVNVLLFFEKDNHDILDCVNCLLEYCDNKKKDNAVDVKQTLVAEKLVLGGQIVNIQLIEQAQKKSHAIEEKNMLTDVLDNKTKPLAVLPKRKL